MRAKAIGITAALVAASLAGSHAPLAAADKDEEDRKPQVYFDLKGCQSIADPSQRLACFDKTAGDLISSAEKGDLRLVDREEVKQVRRSLFGFSLPRIGLFGGGKEEGEAESVELLETTITDVRPLAYDKFQFTIAEGGARWQTIESSPMTREPKVGEKVTLERAALGSYWVRFDGQRAIKGRRVN